MEEPVPVCPEGGILVRTEACGLCSGELMEWYMDRKIPHVIGHEVAGIIEESQDPRFPVGSRVFPHHHAASLSGPFAGTVHSPQWKTTKLIPGGMAERFAVPLPNLDDAHLVDDLRAVDAALVEPLACVMKSLRLAPEPSRTLVVGLGFMGLLHLLMVPGAVGIDTNLARVEWAKNLGLDARAAPGGVFDAVFVCPGSQPAFDVAMRHIEPGGTIVMFAPLPPGEDLRVPEAAYFADLRVAHAYSCAQRDCVEAIAALRAGKVRAEQVVTHFIGISELPSAYEAMKEGRILKPMVIFD